MSLRSNTTFLRLFSGRIVTNMGDSLYYIAAMWLIYDITGSTFFTGIAGFLTKLPSSMQFLFGPIADRYDLRLLLVSTQLIQGVSVLAIPIAEATGYLSVWLILTVIPILGFLNQIVYPAENAALPTITRDKEELVRANSLFAATGQGTDAVFNAVGGVLLSITGAISLFILDSATFGVAVLLFMGVNVQRVDKNEDENQSNALPSYLEEMKAGIDYLRGSTLLKMYVVAMVANFGSGAVFAVLPAFADAIGGPQVYGYLLSAIATGTMTGALGASRVNNYSYTKIVVVGNIISSACFVSVAVVSNVSFILLFAFIGTVPIGINNVIVSSILQSTVDKDLLGRVISLVQSMTALMMPLGNLGGGIIGTSFNASSVILLLAGLQGVIVVVYLVDPDLRSIPEVHRVDKDILNIGAD